MPLAAESVPLLFIRGRSGEERGEPRER